MTTFKDFEAYLMTLKLDDSRCRIHSISVTNERYVVIPWKMVTRNGTNMTLKEAVEEIRPTKRIGSWFLNLKPNIEMRYLRCLD